MEQTINTSALSFVNDVDACAPLFNPFHYYRLFSRQEVKSLRCVKWYVMSWSIYDVLTRRFHFCLPIIDEKPILIAWLFKRINSYREASNELFMECFSVYMRKPERRWMETRKNFDLGRRAFCLLSIGLNFSQYFLFFFLWSI